MKLGIMAKSTAVEPQLLEFRTDGKEITALVQGGELHTVYLNLTNGSKSCDCQDFYFRRKKKGELCKHLKLVLEEMERRLMEGFEK